MTKIKLFDALPKDTPFTSLYSTLDIFLATATKAVFVEEGGGGDRIIIKGENFSYNGTTISGGTITSMAFRNADGDTYVLANQMHLDASKLAADQTGHLDAGELDYEIMRGKDTLISMAPGVYIDARSGDDMIFGTNGRDTFQGEPGDDTYTGGKGRDSFIVGWHPGISYGQDVITDFEANGPKSDRLLIESEPDRITAHGKHDTLLEWGDPSSVTYSSVLLLGVNHQDVTSDDFVLII